MLRAPVVRDPDGAARCLLIVNPKAEIEIAVPRPIRFLRLPIIPKPGHKCFEPSNHDAGRWSGMKIERVRVFVVLRASNGGFSKREMSIPGGILGERRAILPTSEHRPSCGNPNHL